jgi:hypothetical protein
MGRQSSANFHSRSPGNNNQVVFHALRGVPPPALANSFGEMAALSKITWPSEIWATPAHFFTLLLPSI